jgi:hypothetical protein
MRILALSDSTPAAPFGSLVSRWQLEEPRVDGDNAPTIQSALTQLQVLIDDFGHTRHLSGPLSLLVRVSETLCGAEPAQEGLLAALTLIRDSRLPVSAIRLYLSPKASDRLCTEVGTRLPSAKSVQVAGLDPDAPRGTRDANTGFATIAGSPAREQVTSLEVRDAGTGFCRHLTILTHFARLESLVVSHANNVEPPWAERGTCRALHTVVLESVVSLRTLHLWCQPCGADWTHVAPSLRKVCLSRVRMAHGAPDVEHPDLPGAPSLHLGADVVVHGVLEQNLERRRLTEILEERVSMGGLFDSDELAPGLSQIMTPHDVRYMLSYSLPSGDPPIRSVRIGGRVGLAHWPVAEWLPDEPAPELGDLLIELDGKDADDWVLALLEALSRGWRPWQRNGPNITLSVGQTPIEGLRCRASLLAATAMGVTVRGSNGTLVPVHEEQRAALLRFDPEAGTCAEICITDDVSRAAADTIAGWVLPHIAPREIRLGIHVPEESEGLCESLIPSHGAPPLRRLSVNGPLCLVDVHSLIDAVCAGLLNSCCLENATLDLAGLLLLSRQGELIAGATPRIHLSDGHFEQLDTAEHARLQFLTVLRDALPRAEPNPRNRDALAPN